jgi:ferredoxin
MADPRRRLSANAAGDFFVDESCIDCDACRWIAAATFDEADGRSRVHRQPATPEEVRRAELALIACPTGSIGVTQHHDLGAAARAFPVPVDTDVHHCGFHAESSFGAASWLIVRPDGHVLDDSPRFVPTSRESRGAGREEDVHAPRRRRRPREVRGALRLRTDPQ